MQYKTYLILVLGLVLWPLRVAAQSEEPKNNANRKSEIKVNNLNVIYEEDEYKGVVIDRKDDEETEVYIYQAPFVVDPDPDNESDMPQAFTLGDDGVDSEEDILLEGFDTAVIHLPKLAPSNITEPIILDLGAFSWPTPPTSRPSSHFGPRRKRFHYGLDLAQPTGEPIYAAFDGVVRISKFNKSYGNLVIIHHANGLETYYAHMSKRNVTVGEHVKSGDIIGLCGNTGRSYGSHLHFEVRYMGNAINPEHVINCSTHDLVNERLELTSNSFRKVSGNVTSGGNASGGWYRVRQGDTLEKIARRNGTTVKRICQLNGISENKIIHPGDLLRVSGNATASSSTATKSGQTVTNAQSSSSKSDIYIVRSGDTLSKIARDNGTTVKRICEINGISESSIIRVGQKIKLK